MAFLPPPRRWVTGLLLATAAAVTTAASVAPTAAAAAARAPVPAGAVEVWIPLPPPRQPAAAVDTAACGAAYAATGDARTYLCCVDRSLGFCAAAGLEAGADADTLCAVDWKSTTPVAGRQCCFRAQPLAATGGAAASPPRRPPVAPDGTYGAGVAPRLDVDCRAYGRCARGAATRPAPPVEAAAPVGITTEAVARCGSWAPAVYTRCDVTLCEAKAARAVRGRPTFSKSGTAFCGPRAFGNPAKCCLRLSAYWQRAACCRKCVLPFGRRSSFGCCWPGPRPKWVK